MATQRARMSRLLRGATNRAATLAERLDAPRRVRRTVIDFSSLALPSDVKLALADAFWNHFGARSPQQILTAWAYVRVFTRFTGSCASLHSVTDIDQGFLLRYIEWLNAQSRANGEPWTKSSRSSAYTTLRTLLQWLVRCRPGHLGELRFPFNPFPWRNRDGRPRQKLPARQLRAILKACERDIEALRALRNRGERERAAAESSAPVRSFGQLLVVTDEHYGGVVPTHQALSRARHFPYLATLARCGGTRGVEPYLYPRAESLLPYYLAILIHTAGNPGPIAELARDCLQPIPLLDDRQMLVWEKRRAGTPQRRSFRTTDPFEPPALVREIIEWTRRLRPHASNSVRDRLLLFKGVRGVNAWSSSLAKKIIRSDFLRRHGLPHFSLASIRPSVLSAFYRASGDLQQVKAIANHQQVGTTVRYVEAPEVEAQHRVRIAALQRAFLGHISHPNAGGKQAGADAPEALSATPLPSAVPSGQAVSMFGFDCKDPLAGVAPDTRQGELCTNFLGCFTCPNAIITTDSASLARLLQARDHLRAAAAQIHLARWEVIYAPLLRILEEDILPRFAAGEVAGAAHRQSTLPPLPELR
jgi:hypothetical protein